MAGLIAPKTSATSKGAAKAAAAKAAPPAEPSRWYRVLEDRMVPRKGGSFLLKRGKEIQATALPTGGGHYDVKTLESAGVKLLEIDEPEWFTAAQVDSNDKRAALREAGHPIADDDLPAHVPTRARAKTAAPAEPAS